ncbi:DNA-directed RNA polymerase I subunit RPA43 [Dermatophagoides farinae]|uniref:Uncharacterized protein n=1 Tax=Dermatophagoides farinae TaxID=6954 RepID=A0A922I6T6_DERFA|nr:uncharacterized protein LOC124490225 [Dermatophagoides farinae]KAH7639143.1 hypothetical protein HUG17_3176 [Dermatophagoides farinae]KAH9522343.1 hypothetical protein DERF_005923 [Dermatophagoides farinae]
MTSEIIDGDSLTKIITKELDIGLYPQFMGREESCVNKLLKQRKFKYNPDLNGILIRFDDLEFLTDTGRIIDDSPLIFWKIRGKFHIFNVQPNQILKSFINRIGKEYIGCSFAGCIDVTIKFECQTFDHEQIDDICSSLNISDSITFKVKRFIPTQRYIEGIIDDEIFRIILNDNNDNKNRIKR